ncbi:MAG: polysaccharide biosynthesis tyrosine autokinase [Leptolyngbyaceae cyanobacterium MO_188.B28]|nr:polysaccharide biosynthesis tyrosine autokinase [Leptolyngbyaceae cyanobacterium MO_188.B28]
MQAVDTEIGIDQYWQILKRRWLPASLVFVGVAATVSAYGFSQTSIYEAEGKLRFKSKDATSTLTGLGDELGQLESLDGKENPIATEIAVMRTVPIIQKTIDQLKLKDADDKPVNPERLLSRLEVSNERGTDILKVAYQLPDGEAAKAVVDTLMAVYLDQHLLDNRAEAAAAREFIEKQLPDAEKRARRAEAALRDFKERNQVVALEEEASATVDSLEDLQVKITDVTSQLANADARFSALKGRLGRNPQAALAAAAVSQSSGVQQVLAAYQDVESKLAAERVRFQDQHPMIIDLETERTNLDILLQERIRAVIGSQDVPEDVNFQVGEVEADLIGDYVRLEAQLKGLVEQADTLQAVDASYLERASALPRLEQEQRELVRQLDAAQSTYALLLQRLQEVRVAENQNVGNVHIIQPAVVLSSPVAPRKKLYVVTGAMLGGLLAAATALVLEAQDRSIKTVEEAKAQFNLPVLGVIPTFAKETQSHRFRDTDERAIPTLVVCSEMPSPSSEAYHMLRNNLKFLDSDHPPRVIVVTSSVSREGKSTVASNLAASIAQTGKRVLLVDADLHRPIQHGVWDLPNCHGLSNLLVGQVVLRDTISQVMSNLWVLLAGAPPPNPASLLDSQRMIALLQKFQAHYDYVILDAPALSGGASASIVGKMSDGLLLVVRPNVADSASIDYAKTLIEQSQQKVLGLVVNSALSHYEPYGQYLSDEFYITSPPTSDQVGEEALEMDISSADRNGR